MPQQSFKNANGRKNSLFSASKHSSKPSSTSSSSVTSPLAVQSPSYAELRDNSPPIRSVSSRHRHSSSVTSGDFVGVTATLRRSLSLRSITTSVRSIKLRSPSTATFNNFFQEDEPQPPPQASKSLFSLSTITKRQKSSDQVRDFSDRSRPSTAMTMTTTATYRNQPLAKTTSNTPPSLGVTYGNGSMTNNSVSSVPVSGSLTPQATYQTILDTASKRISTLDYLRKASVFPPHPYLPLASHSN
jgi:hypothetical protein